MDKKEKLSLVALELIRRSGGRIYKTKLFKLLYYCDFISQARHDVPISGVDYKAWDDGPVPTILWGGLVYHPDEFPALSIERSESATDWGECVAVSADYAQTQTLSLEELAIIDEVWDKYGSLTGAQLIEQTHREAPWKLTYSPESNSNAVIDYSLAYMEFEEDYQEEEDGPPVHPQLSRELEDAVKSIGAKIL